MTTLDHLSLWSREQSKLQNSDSKLAGQLEQLFPKLSNEDKEEMLNLLRNKDKPWSLLIKIKRELVKTSRNPVLLLQELLKQEQAIHEEQKDIQRSEEVLKASITSNMKQDILSDNDTTLSSNDTTLSSNDTTLSSNDTTLSQKNSVFFRKDSSLLGFDTALSEKDTALSESTAKVFDIKDERGVLRLYRETLAYQKDLKSEFRTHTDAEKQEKLESLSPKLQRQLKKSGIPLEEYASFLLSREKIGKDYQDPRNIAFLKSLERLERNLGISEQTAGGYPTSFEWKTKTFRENPDLKTFVQKSQDFSDLEKLEYFGNEREHEENEKLIALFGDHDLQELHRLCTPLLEKNIQEQSPSEQQLLQTYQQQLEHLKAKQKNELLLDMKASTINAPIPMMMHYLDKESLGGKSLANLLEKAPQDAISIHTEGKGLSWKSEEIMHIKGTIDGHALTFYYNLSDPEATLSCDDSLHFNTASGLFELGEATGARTKLNIQMPSIKNLAENIGKFCDPEVCKALISQSSSKEEYHERLKEKIADALQSSFSYDQRIASRISRHTEKNLAMQTFQSTFIPPGIFNQLTHDKLINQDPQMKNLFHLLDRTSEMTTSFDLQQFRASIKRFQSFFAHPEKIEKLKHPVLKGILSDLYHSQNQPPRIEERSKSLIRLLNLFTKNTLNDPHINPQDPEYLLSLNDFSLFTQVLELPDHHLFQEKYLAYFSPTFKEKYRMLADEEQKKQLTQLDKELDQQFEKVLENSFA